MIPISSLTVKPAKEMQAGEMGFLLVRGTSYPIIGGITRDDLPVAVIFEDEKVRIESTGAVNQPVLIIDCAEIIIDPQSGRKVSLGEELWCPVLIGDSLFIEADYQTDLYQIALGPIAEPPKGDRIAFPRWRIVRRHDGTEYEILSRAPVSE